MVDNKGHREYIGTKKRDIHEADSEHLRNAEEAYLEVAKNKGWTIIDCTDGDKILSIEDIHKKVWAVVEKTLEK